MVQEHWTATGAMRMGLTLHQQIPGQYLKKCPDPRSMPGYSDQKHRSWSFWLLQSALLFSSRWLRSSSAWGIQELFGGGSKNGQGK